MYNIPRNPLQLINYAFTALGKTQVSLQQLIFFIAFDLHQMPPSQVAKLIQDLQAQGQLEVNDDVVTLSEKMTSEAAPHDTAPVTNIGELLRLFTGSSRLSRAVGMSDKAIDFQYVSQTPLKIEAIVHGSQEYDLTLDEANRSISHNCPDWRRVSVLRRFCKHVAKLFLLLEKDQAIRVLQLLQQESWKFDQS